MFGIGAGAAAYYVFSGGNGPGGGVGPPAGPAPGPLPLHPGPGPPPGQDEVVPDLHDTDGRGDVQAVEERKEKDHMGATPDGHQAIGGGALAEAPTGVAVNQVGIWRSGLIMSIDPRGRLESTWVFRA